MSIACCDIGKKADGQSDRMWEDYNGNKTGKNGQRMDQ